jgi:exonuclease III
MLGQAEECDDDEEPDLLDWQEADWETAKRVVFTGRFVRLPTKFDVHEWAIMQDFALSVESTRISEELLRAIHGKGAFRMFKDAIQRHRIESTWFDFRAEALKHIAIEWCEENQIVWE